jgi:hypothetical protein
MFSYFKKIPIGISGSLPCKISTCRLSEGENSDGALSSEYGPYGTLEGSETEFEASSGHLMCPFFRVNTTLEHYHEVGKG